MSDCKPEITAELLHDLYHVQEMYVLEIAEKLHVSKTTILNSMQKFGIAARPRGHRRNALPINPDGLNTGTPLELTICPVSADRLRELYEKHAMGAYDIADYLTHIVGGQPGINSGKVRLWLLKLEVKMRNLSHANSIACKNHAKERNANAKQALKKGQPLAWASENHKKAGQQNIKVAHKAHLKSCAEKRIQCICTCGKVFERRPSRQKYAKQFFCSYQCSNKHTAHQRSIRAKTRRAAELSVYGK